jgi:hypothetical protein
MVTTPCDDTFATVALSVRQVAVLVRSSVVPSDNVTLAENCDWPTAVKLEAPVTVTLEMVGGAGATGGGDGGVGAPEVGAVGLLEHPITAVARHTTR